MQQSILTSIKKILGIDASYTAFDLDIVIHINSVLARLHQLGIGPVGGFTIEDSTATWGDFLGPVNHTRFSQVKTYVYLCVRIIFDPPQTSYLLDAMEKQIAMMEWTLNAVREEDSWTDPSLPAA